MSLISARGVSRLYRTHSLLKTGPAHRVLQDVSLDIDAGETVALLGRSGCGKSTLARLLCGLERPDEGDVLYQGTPIHTLTRDQRKAMLRDVQMVFQDSPSATDPRFSIDAIISEPLRHLTALTPTQRHERVLALLDRVELPASMATMHPHHLSGGQLQRVCIARALACSPRLIILDEAVSNLDLHLQASTLAFLRDMQARDGIAYLFVTHDLRLVERFSSRVAVMDQGRIVETSTSTQVKDLHHPASRCLLEAVLPPWPTHRSETAPRISAE